MNQPANTPGERLRLYREAAGISQRDLAEASGVSHSTIHTWESGRSGLHDSWPKHRAQIEAIARALKIQPSAIWHSSPGDWAPTGPGYDLAGDVPGDPCSGRFVPGSAFGARPAPGSSVYRLAVACPADRPVFPRGTLLATEPGIGPIGTMHVLMVETLRLATRGFSAGTPWVDLCTGEAIPAAECVGRVVAASWDLPGDTRRTASNPVGLAVDDAG